MLKLPLIIAQNYSTLRHVHCTSAEKNIGVHKMRDKFRCYESILLSNIAKTIEKDFAHPILKKGQINSSKK